MARDLLSIVGQMMREAERNARRSQREAERQNAQQCRDAVRAQKAREKARQQAARSAEARRKNLTAEVKATYIAAREAEVEALNAELAETYSAIDRLLVATLDVDDYFDLESLRRKPKHPPFEHAHLQRPTTRPAEIQDPPEPTYEEPPPPKVLFGKKKKHEAAITAAQAAHGLALKEWRSTVKALPSRRTTLQEEFERAEQKRLEELEKEKARYSRECAERDQEVAEYNARLDSLIANLGYGVADAVEDYFEIVFSRSIYPTSFSVVYEFNFEPSTAELCLSIEVPSPSEVESKKAHRYVKKNDEIVSTELSQKARKDRYGSAVNQVALRSIHEVFEADRRALIKTVSLEVGTNSADPATGKMKFILLATVAAEREAFLEFDLSAVVPKNTLEHLGAALSKNPFGLIAADRSGVRRA
jgi:restriction system protein